MDWIPQYIRMYAFIDVSMGSYSRGWQLSTYVHAILCILTIIYNCFILLLLVCEYGHIHNVLAHILVLFYSALRLMICCSKW